VIVRCYSRPPADPRGLRTRNIRPPVCDSRYPTNLRGCGFCGARAAHQSAQAGIPCPEKPRLQLRSHGQPSGWHQPYGPQRRISCGSSRAPRAPEPPPAQSAWLSVDLPLNSGLIAVIGNKVSGKSALAEVIGLAGGSPHEDHFSFLTGSKFRDTHLRLAENFDGELLRQDQDSSVTGLADAVETGHEARVQHLPQRYLESLAVSVLSERRFNVARTIHQYIAGSRNPCLSTRSAKPPEQNSAG